MTEKATKKVKNVAVRLEPELYQQAKVKLAQVAPDHGFQDLIPMLLAEFVRNASMSENQTVTTDKSSHANLAQFKFGAVEQANVLAEPIHEIQTELNSILEAITESAVDYERVEQACRDALTHHLQGEFERIKADLERITGLKAAGGQGAAKRGSGKQAQKKGVA